MPYCSKRSYVFTVYTLNNITRLRGTLPLKDKIPFSLYSDLFGNLIITHFTSYYKYKLRYFEYFLCRLSVDLRRQLPTGGAKYMRISTCPRFVPTSHLPNIANSHIIATNVRSVYFQLLSPHKKRSTKTFVLALR